MIKVLYGGKDITASAAFMVAFAETGPAYVPTDEELRKLFGLPDLTGEREVIVTLPHGESWRDAYPKSCRRGDPIQLDVNDEHYVGRVRYRRLNRMVIDGRFG